mgnify:CR=1 FL=1
MTMFDKILVPTDGSELSIKAVEHAIDYCKRTGAALTVLYVRSPKPTEYTAVFADYSELQSPSTGVIKPEAVRERLEGYGRDVLQRVADGALKQGVKCDTLLEADERPYRAIIDVAEREDIGMIFMASHGRSGFEAILLGSETQKVLTHSKIPVLVFR